MKLYLLILLTKIVFPFDIPKFFNAFSQLSIVNFQLLEFRHFVIFLSATMALYRCGRVFDNNKAKQIEKNHNKWIQIRIKKLKIKNLRTKQR